MISWPRCICLHNSFFSFEKFEPVPWLIELFIHSWVRRGMVGRGGRSLMLMLTTSNNSVSVCRNCDGNIVLSAVLAANV
jgi:hypothetical protein